MTSPSYSPTQSPSLSLSPVYIPPGDSPSTPPSPKYSFSLIDLTSPYSPTDESAIMTLPPLPPLPPPSISPPPPPPPPPPLMPPGPPTLPDPVPTTYTRYGEPLPPGEDILPNMTPDREPFMCATPAPQDMDIDSGDDAESKFLSHPNLFPASVWDFASQQLKKRTQK